MKNIKTDADESLRPEYKRSDLGDLVPGKYATTQVDFHQLVEVLLACIGEDEGIRFTYHSAGNDRARRNLGDWTYELDNSNQITLRYWLSELGSVEEVISNPPVVITLRDRTEFQDALLRGVTALKTKVALLNDRK